MSLHLDFSVWIFLNALLTMSKRGKFQTLLRL